MDVMDEWTAAGDYTVRRDNVRTASVPGEGDLLEDATVFEDGDRNILTGSQDRDLYFADLAGGLIDVLIGKAIDEDAYDL